MSNYKEYAQLYTQNAPTYIDGLIFIQSGVEKSDIDALKMRLRRLCADNEGLSFMLITSSHESKGKIKKVTIRTGKPGRPPTVVKGKKAVNHCHGLIVNENISNDIQVIKKVLQTYFKMHRRKRSDLKRPQIMDAWKNNLSIIKYMARQSDETFRAGTFNFDYFLSEFYMPDDPRENNFDNI